MQQNFDYYQAWVQGIFDQGFYPGVYCFPFMANALMQVDMRPTVWVVDLNHAAGIYQDPLPNNDPFSSGYFGANVWQLAQKCTIRVTDNKGIRRSFFPIDFDTASTTDPSNFLDFVNV